MNLIPRVWMVRVTQAKGRTEVGFQFSLTLVCLFILCVGTCMPLCTYRGQRTTSNWFSLCTIWVPEVKLRLSGLPANACTCWAPSLTQHFNTWILMKQVPGPPFSVSHGIIHLELCLLAQKVIMLPQLETLKKQNGDMGRLFKQLMDGPLRSFQKYLFVKLNFVIFHVVSIKKNWKARSIA